MQPIQNAIYDKFLLIDKLLKSSPYLAEDFYETFRELHIKTLFNVNSQQLKLQKQMIDNQMQNFGQIRSAKESLNQSFGVKQILRKMFSKLYLFKNTEIVFRILQRYNLNIFIKIIYKFKSISLCKKYKK